MKLEDLIIDESLTIIEALKKLDSSAKKVVFICDGRVLKAALTDGDIRRWILKNGDLSTTVSNVANYEPRFVYSHEQEKAQKLIKKSLIDALPILNSSGEIIDVVFSREENVIKSDELKTVPIVITAGGLGTRLYPYTKILPKPLIPVGELPIMEHIINKFRDYGANDFHLIVNHKKNMIKAYFNEIEKDYNIYFADEDKPLGTGGGLALIENDLKSTFVFTNCDILIDEDYGKVYDFHKNSNNIVTMICSLKDFVIPYGVVEVLENGQIGEMREKPSFSFLTNTGCYFVEAEIFKYIKKDESIGFPDIIDRCSTAGGKVGVFPISEGAWADMGQMEELEKMRERFKS